MRHSRVRVGGRLWRLATERARARVRWWVASLVLTSVYVSALHSRSLGIVLVSVGNYCRTVFCEILWMHFWVEFMVNGNFERSLK
ncbi:hypothetical protein B0H11DRAFT_1953787 [Mycena galericulata]|nr:hypothetical protein B0H11DRAFT_1953787 [Mycena galericulata]